MPQHKTVLSGKKIFGVIQLKFKMKIYLRERGVITPQPPFKCFICINEILKFVIQLKKTKSLKKWNGFDQFWIALYIVLELFHIT